jgi:hypothetical protein
MVRLVLEHPLAELDEVSLVGELEQMVELAYLDP